MTYNYRWMTKALVEAGGGRMAADQPALLAALEELLDNPEQAREMGRRGADFVRAHQGGAARTLELLKPLLARARADGPGR
jgi:3-deoxy-D-manno-octulosonic-acid transferase